MNKLNKKTCPCCAHLNQQAAIRCTQCGARMDETYVDCYACNATGRVTLNHTAEFARQADGDSVLPCAKCDATGKLPLELIRSEIVKRTALELIEALNLI